MNLIKSTFVYIFLTVVFIFVSCDSVSTDQKEEFVSMFLFMDETDTALLDERINKYSLTQEQVRFQFENKIVGLSAEFNSEQLSRLTHDFTEHELQTIPGEFIITFIDPYDGEKSGSEEGAQWSFETITKLQEKYGIDNNQILHRYGYALRGFTAKLNDKQLFGLDNDSLVKEINPNAKVSVNLPSIHNTQDPSGLQ